MTVAHNSVVCKGFIPAQREIAIRRLDVPRFRGPPVADLLGFWAEAYSYPTT